MLTAQQTCTKFGEYWQHDSRDFVSKGRITFHWELILRSGVLFFRYSSTLRQKVWILCKYSIVFSSQLLTVLVSKNSRMIPQVHWFCFTLPCVAMGRADVLMDKTVFRKCAQEKLCENPLAELEPYGILQCFTKCLQFASCSYANFNSKKLVCRMCMASNNMPAGKLKNRQRDEDSICRKKVRTYICHF